MSYISIHGGRVLEGKVNVQGAKNSILPILAACLLCHQPCTIHRCPKISDVSACVRILRHLGCVVTWNEHSLTVDPRGLCCTQIPDELMSEMRSSIVFLGALLARCGETALSFPGGCELGPRPIDLHLSALTQLGAVVNEEGGVLQCRADKLSGCEIVLPIPSVGATENIMIAATAAKGTTVIRNAAREPEIVDLACFLNRCGAKINGCGEGTVQIEGTGPLFGCEHTVIPDRIVAATYMAAIAVSGGKGELSPVIPQHVSPVLPFFRQSGCTADFKGNRLLIKAPKRLRSMQHIVTGYFPGFPTDAQPALMAMAAVADGTGIFIENIFENRYNHVHDLTRMGAKIKAEGRMAVVEGVPTLSGCRVKACDLRGGAALVVAGLAAAGETQVHNVGYIQRGHQDIVADLAKLGADIKTIR